MKMFGFIKRIFSQETEHQSNGWGTSLAQPEPVSPPVLQSGSESEMTFAPTPRSSQNGNEVYLSLMSVLSALPVELKARIRVAGIGDITIAVPMEVVLPQLAHGVVKISFGELRKAAPEIFSSEGDLDYLKVTLPLSEILAQLNSSSFVRRQSQKHIEVPEEVAGPFGKGAQGVSFASTLLKPAAPGAARSTPPPLPSYSLPPRNSLSAAPPLPPPPALQPASPLPLISTPPVFHELNAAHAAPRTPPQSEHLPVECLSVPLGALAENWPEALRLEITQLDLTHAHVSLPVDVIEQALKRGKIAFTWKALRSWIKPAPLPSVSAHDGSILELPLQVVTPLFLAKKSAKMPRQKIKIDQSIPDLFYGVPQPGAPAHVKQGDTNAYKRNGAAEPIKPPVATPHPAAKVPGTPQSTTTTFKRKPTPDTSLARKPAPDTTFTRKPTPGTNFLSRYATPNEVVSRAAAMEGVAGALISLPDGLMVASQLAPDMNADMLAAFLPQIYSRVSQCANELRMGELNNVSFTVGNVPWRIFRVSAIFFAAFGRPGESLPVDRLAALAAELERKKTN